MYLVGAEHPNKGRAKLLLEKMLLAEEALVTDAEVFQEILHRYVALGRQDAIGPAFKVLNSIVAEIYPVEFVDVGAARAILEKTPTMTARDAIHLAIMRRREVTRIFSFDRDFDGHPGVLRVH